MKIAIIDYGAGNTANVKNAFGKLGAETIVSASQQDFAEADALILPGVGTFGAAMKRLKPIASGISDEIERGKPFLGICLGMQLLLETSEESDGVNGLGLVAGNVRKLPPGLPVPQMGWNLVEDRGSELFEDLDSFYAYFVHSYYCCPKNGVIVAAVTSYGITFPSAFASRNLFATQFHPEKSGKKGLDLLGNFLKVVRK